MMPDVTVVFWRDIPAQVIVRKGRRAVKAVLPEQFEQAIDRAATQVSPAETEAYLVEWRKASPYRVEGEPADIVATEAAQLDTDYDQSHLKPLIEKNGWA